MKRNGPGAGRGPGGGTPWQTAGRDHLRPGVGPRWACVHQCGQVGDVRYRWAFAECRTVPRAVAGHGAAVTTRPDNGPSPTIEQGADLPPSSMRPTVPPALPSSLRPRQLPRHHSDRETSKPKEAARPPTPKAPVHAARTAPASATARLIILTCPTAALSLSAPRSRGARLLARHPTGRTRQPCQHPARPPADHRSHNGLAIVYGGPLALTPITRDLGVCLSVTG